MSINLHRREVDDFVSDVEPRDDGHERKDEGEKDGSEYMTRVEVAGGEGVEEAGREGDGVRGRLDEAEPKLTPRGGELVLRRHGLVWRRW